MRLVLSQTEERAATDSRLPKSPRLDPTQKLLSHGRSQTAQRLLQSGLELFSDQGFHAATTREISINAGLSAAALYVHFESKERLLYELSKIAHADSLEAIRITSDERSSNERLGQIAYQFTYWHASHVTLARVAQNELSSLSVDHFSVISNIRRRTERIFRREIERGRDRGQMSVPDVKYATVATMALSIDVARWFRQGSGQGADQLARHYSELVLRMVRAEGSSEAPMS
jgi:AcrR family transcriptional regulator